MYWYGTTKNEANTQQFLDEGMTLYSMDWTTETPTQEGWYWAYGVNSSEVLIIRVTRFLNSGELSPMWGSQKSHFGYFSHWLGPIPPPEMPE